MSSGHVPATSVQALVVTQNGDLTTLLNALADQSETLSSVFVIITRETTDEYVQHCSKQLRDLFGERGAIVQVPDAPNFGEAIRAALTSDAMRDEPAWYWLLHDDVKPAASALEHLLDAANQGAAIAAVGPKQVGWDDPHLLLELGIEATGSGRRVPLGVAQEIDQGQHDDRFDVLAVGTAGMLVRSDRWRQLRGLDPHLGPYGDGLEFGRRLRRAGQRVVVAPKAVLAHRQDTLNTQGRAKGFQMRRSAQLYNWLLAVPPLVPPLLLVLLLAWTPVRALARLLQRQGKMAAAELGAYALLLAALPALARGRRRTARVATVPRRALRPLQATAAQLEARRHHARRVRRSRLKPVDLVDAASRRALLAHRRSSRTALGVALAVAAVGSIYFWYPLTGGFAGASWAQLPGTFPELWKEAWSGWVYAGVGAPGPVNPVLQLFSLGAPAGLAGITPTQVMTWLLYGAVVFAAALGWLVARLFTHSPAWKLAAALTFAFQPGLLAALAQGNIAATLPWLGLPLTFVGLYRATRPPVPLTVEGVEDFSVLSRYEPTVWGAVAALGTVIAAAGAPGVVLAAVPLAYLMALVPWPSRVEQEATMLGADRQGASWRVDAAAPPLKVRAGAATLAWVPAAVLSLPSLTLFFRDSLRSTAPWGVLFPQPEGIAPTGLPGYAWVSAIILLAWAAIALVRSSWSNLGSPRVAWGAMLTAAGLLWLHAAANLPAVETPGVALSLLVVALAGTPPGHVRTQRGTERFQYVPPAVALGAAVTTFLGTVVLGPLAPGKPGALQTGPETKTPLVATEAARAPEEGRTLRISQSEPDVLGASLLRGGAPGQADFSWGLTSATQESVRGARQTLAQTVGNLAAKPGGTAAESLAAHNVQLVLLDADSVTGPGTLQAHLDGTEGIERIGTVDAGTMWRVRPEGAAPAEFTAWGNEETTPVLTGRKFATSGFSVLVVAEPASPHWQASVGSVPLETAPDPDPDMGWRQAFKLPEDASGILNVKFAPAWLPWWSISSWTLLLITLVAAVPWRKNRPLWLLHESPPAALEPDEPASQQELLEPGVEDE